MGALVGRMTEDNFENICTFFTRSPTEVSTVAIQDAGKRCEILKIGAKKLFAIDEVKQWSADNLKFLS